MMCTGLLVGFLIVFLFTPSSSYIAVLSCYLHIFFISGTCFRIMTSKCQKINWVTIKKIVCLRVQNKIKGTFLMTNLRSDLINLHFIILTWLVFWKYRGRHPKTSTTTSEYDLQSKSSHSFLNPLPLSFHTYSPFFIHMNSNYKFHYVSTLFFALFFFTFYLPPCWFFRCL